MSNTSDQELGKNIQKARKAAGLSQEQLAMKLGVTRQAISSWERGIEKPSLDNIAELASALNVSIDSLYGRAQPASKGKGIKMKELMSMKLSDVPQELIDKGKAYLAPPEDE